ncbi:MAG: hypothetical protein KatS3mg077_0621 [Candidatus Binatia bacterium]|nr:MAG: hypothetical protein KatS3mg077_0621 [Candidatus Binatia bacterium]
MGTKRSASGDPRQRNRGGGPGALVLWLVVAILAWVTVRGAIVPATADSGAPADQRGQGGEEKTLWTCSMHPQVIRDAPGLCPICGMQLTPLHPRSSTRHGEESLVIDPRIEQNMGLRVVEVTRAPLRATVRAYAEVRERESTVRDLTLRTSGWIERLYASYEGVHVAKGAPLFDVYSPDLQAAIGEWVSLHRTGSPDPALRRAVRRKLEQLGLGDDQIDLYAQAAEPPRTVTFHATAPTHVVAKFVNEGARVEAGQPILRVNDRFTMWLDAQVYEQDLPYIQLGQEIEARVIGVPGKTFRGKIMFLHPHVETPARVIIARAEIANDEGLLRQGMAATAEISGVASTDAIVVPKEAIIDTGERKVAFVLESPGHFELRTVETGPTGADGLVGITRGLEIGEKVVVNGQFLLDAESRLREAARKFATGSEEGAAHGGHSH